MSRGTAVRERGDATGSTGGAGRRGGSGRRRSWPHRFPVGYRSTVLLAVFVALLALVYGFYRVVPSGSHANLGDRGPPAQVTGKPTTTRSTMPTTTRSTTSATAPATTSATTAAPATTPLTSTVPGGNSATSTTLAPKAQTTSTVPVTAAVPAAVPAPAVAPGPLAWASSSPAFDGSSIQVTVTAVLTRGGDGYAGQGVTYTGPGCSSASALTASDGSATGVLTCTAASTIPITVAAAGKSVVTKVQA